MLGPHDNVATRTSRAIRRNLRAMLDKCCLRIAHAMANKIFALVRATMLVAADKHGTAHASCRRDVRIAGQLHITTSGDDRATVMMWPNGGHLPVNPSPVAGMKVHIGTACASVNRHIVTAEAD